MLTGNCPLRTAEQRRRSSWQGNCLQGAEGTEGAAVEAAPGDERAGGDLAAAALAGGGAVFERGRKVPGSP